MMRQMGAAWLGRRLDRTIHAISYDSPEDPLGRRVVVRAIERITGQPRLQRIYEAYLAARRDGDNLWQMAAEYLNLTVRYDPAALAAIPRTGPLIVVANHPYGAPDGIALGYITSQVRSDFKVMAHAVLERAEALRPYLIPINFDPTAEALRANIEAKRAALAHLAEGGAIIIYPGGGVSTAPHVFGRATDLPWKRFVGRLITTTHATVVPIFFEGQASWVFHLVSRFSETLRQAMLMREVAARIGAEITAHIGAPIPFSDLTSWTDRQALLDYLRSTVYGLDPAPQRRAA